MSAGLRKKAFLRRIRSAHNYAENQGVTQWRGLRRSRTPKHPNLPTAFRYEIATPAISSGEARIISSIKAKSTLVLIATFAR
jgi:hypothetical protein